MIEKLISTIILFLLIAGVVCAAEVQTKTNDLSDAQMQEILKNFAERHKLLKSMDPDEEAYISDLDKTIQQFWACPMDSSGLSATARIKVHKEGRLEVKIDKSSGNKEFDKCIYECIRNTSLHTKPYKKDLEILMTFGYSREFTSFKRLDSDLKENLSKSRCVKSWKRKTSVFTINFNSDDCRPNDPTSALLVVRKMYELNNAKFPKTIELNFDGTIESYPFNTIGTIIK